MLQMEKSLAFKDKQVGALTQEMRMLQDRYAQPLRALPSEICSTIYARCRQHRGQL